MTAVNITALIVGLLALFMTFKAKYVVENLLHKEATEGMVLRVKCIALVLAVIACLTVFIIGR